MILDGLNVPYKVIDITVRGNEPERDLMKQKALERKQEPVFPPQFMFKDEYLGVSFLSE